MFVKDFEKALEQKPHSDRELIEACLHGEQEYFAVLVNRYKGNVATTIYNMTGDRDLTVELAQQTFISLYRSLNRFRSESTLKTYIVRIAINLTINELKRLKKRKYDSLDAAGKWLCSPADSHEDREMLSKALQMLKAEQRIIITLRHIEGYSTKECAEILEIPEGTVLSRLSRSIEAMRIALIRLGYENHTSNK